MATTAPLLNTPETGIVALVEANPVMVLTDRQKFSQFYEAIKAETDALVVDLETDKGRKAVAAMAYKVARTKTAIDDAGKKLNEEARSRINAIDESRREIRQQLDDLKEEVRRPLTEWEEAEAARVANIEAVIEMLRQAATIGYDETAGQVRERLAEIVASEPDPAKFDGYMPQVAALRDQAIAALTAAAERMDQEEAQRVELGRLRAEAAEREAQEAARAEAEEAERRRAEAEKAEAERKAQAEADEKARIEAAARAAEEVARADAERKAAEERAAAEREHAEAIAAERRRADELAAAEAARKAEEDRVARELAAREADLAHRGTIMSAAKEAIMEAGSIEEAVARNIVLAIAAGSIPHTRITF